MTFRDKVVVVTGGASGIGRAVCARFTRAGARIALLDLDEAAVHREVGRLAGTVGDVLGVRCDVSSQTDCEEAGRKILARFGGVDVLVNNAGITQRAAFVDTDLAVFRKVMDVNFYGSLNCTKVLLPSLLERKGQLIVVESIAGLAPLPGRTGYCASKHALHGLFTTLRTEVRSRGVHVMIVCPGFVKTNLQSRALGGDGAVTSRAQSTVGAMDSPERVAEAIYRGACRRQPMLVLTLAGRLAYWVNRLWPSLYERIIEHKFRSELERPRE